jgi:hypothetical protein
MKWLKKKFQFILRVLMNKEKQLYGTELKASEIKSAYIVTENGRKICIVITTQLGIETYPYTPELENDVMAALSVDKLEEKEFSIDYLITIFNRHENVMSTLKSLTGNPKNTPT